MSSRSPSPQFSPFSPFSLITASPSFSLPGPHPSPSSASSCLPSPSFFFSYSLHLPPTPTSFKMSPFSILLPPSPSLSLVRVLLPLLPSHAPFSTPILLFFYFFAIFKKAIFFNLFQAENLTFLGILLTIIGRTAFYFIYHTSYLSNFL
jgi:hypothetical protein